jgi:K(+)-stimulated pyrophosphate-energized sodium pump
MYWLYYGAPLVTGLAAVVYSIVKPFLLSRRHVEDQGFLRYSAQVKKHTLSFVGGEYRIIAALIGVAGLPLFFLKSGHSRLVVLSFLIGAIVTAGAGLCGTVAAVYSNRLTVLAARRSTMKGSVLGFAVVGFSLTAVTLLLVLLTALFGSGPEALRGFVLPNLFGYTLGAGLVAVLGRSAGGIFAKAADISADLAGKYERGLEEDDSRNPASLADAVGDNVNDITGLGLDLSESYAAALLSCMLVGAASGRTSFIYLPLVLAASGIVISFLALIFIKTPEYGRPETAVMRWLVSTHLVLAAAGAAASLFMMEPAEAYGISGAYAVGILCGILVSLFAGYYTASGRRPVISIAAASGEGITPSIIQGLATGMGSTVLPLLTLIGTLLLAYRLSGFYGVTIAAFGLMSGAAVHAGVDAAGTIIDNAGAFAMLAMFPPASRERTDKLDVMGNAFNAVGKGYTVCSATAAKRGVSGSGLTA